jgi:pilus assembly protein CpaB
MSLRKFLLVLGVVFIGAGMYLAVIWVNNRPAPVETSQPKPAPAAALVALSHIPAGTLLREGDIGWKELSAAEIRPDYLMRGTASEAELFGAITRRDFVKGEPLTAAELVKSTDRRFLAIVLRPGHRAVSISIDAPQTASGLALPGDLVDVILVQNFGDNVADAGHRAAGEIVLRSLRVLATDQTLVDQVKPPPGQTPGEVAPTRIPQTITLEADERQAQKLYVANQLGKLHIALRPLRGSGTILASADDASGPVWASETSLAIRQMISGGSAAPPAAAPESEPSEPSGARQAPAVRSPSGSGSTLEMLLRWPPRGAPE